MRVANTMNLVSCGSLSSRRAKVCKPGLTAGAAERELEKSGTWCETEATMERRKDDAEGEVEVSRGDGTIDMASRGGRRARPRL